MGWVVGLLGLFAALVVTFLPVSVPPSATSTEATSSVPASTSDTPAPTTAAPTPSDTSSAPAGSGGQPGPGNTGVPAGTVLKQHVGDLVITTPGATYSNLDIHGFVYVRAPNVTLKNSIVRGGVATQDIGLVTNVDAGARNFVIQDSELVPEHPSVWEDGLKGWNYTAIRVDIHGTVDTAKVYGDNTTIRDSWLHDTQYYASDPNQGGQHTHNDGVQVLSGNNIHIEHNTITNSYNAALQVTQDHGAVSGLFFQDNWADGGGCTVNINSKPMGSMSTVTVTDNKFGHDTRVANCPIVASTDVPLDTARNVFVNSTKFAAVRPLGSQVNCGNAFQAAQTSDVIGGSDTRSAIAGQCVNDGQQRLIIAIICFVGGIVLGAVVGSWEGRR